MKAESGAMRSQAKEGRKPPGAGMDSSLELPEPQAGPAGSLSSDH